ncbi:Protein of unknown function, DUF488 [Saccharopolyspora kobensis]|uniref:DUF488 domain-containing protein n=1 Tax=Saccharopolyspora kobensis TaxID=146035 RepID=A0A1H5ZTT7_9PSEU|nr:DUF488 domain-containing protein [Saccharopolyspora kobensis]SEG39117.1 Protein of unknown function, DUF488 [Saccharopolyspora kobensis]SFE13092.1 Protein of unknown function, DUF488 [Saccharopolyspora kobensis]
MLTFGHGTADAATMTGLLRGAGVRELVDVRTAPGSRRNPDAARAAMSHWVPEEGIGYRWESRLGGWRRAHPDGPDTALRNRSFAGYAEHMRTADFRAAVDDLLTDSATELNAVMCAESLWWRCHRKMIADYLTLVRGVPVGHLMHDGKIRPHRPSPEARLLPERGVLIYDAGQPPLDAG